MKKTNVQLLVLLAGCGKSKWIHATQLIQDILSNQIFRQVEPHRYVGVE